MRRGGLPLPKKKATAAMVAWMVLLPALANAACPFASRFGGGHGTAAAHDHGSSRMLLQSPAPPPAKYDAAAVAGLDWKGVRADLTKLMTDSQAFWPADFGHYGGLFIRLAWHCNGSYRTWDGRGGCDGARIRFTPELTWEDNANLDKARRLLEPVKAKYGSALSWGDLIVLAGDIAISSMGGPSTGFCAGRIDDASGAASLPLGPTAEQRVIAPCTVGDGMCEQPLGQTTMGLIYVNPEGVMGEPIPKKSVEQIRGTFGRMGMNDAETVALIGGGHAFGKTHGACRKPADLAFPNKKDLKNLWPPVCGNGKGKNAFTSGFEGPWTTQPTAWDNEYFKNLLDFDWQKHKGPGGHWQWEPRFKGAKANNTEDLPGIMMLTADLALLEDPIYLGHVKRFAGNLTALTDEFGKAWYKLMTRDMGPVTRCLGPDVPAALPWQLPLPQPAKQLADFDAVAADVKKLLATSQPGVSPADRGADGRATYAAQLAQLAGACAGTFRATDYAGGCNGARIRFAPQKDWPDNKGLDKVLKLLEPVKAKYGAGLSWADLIVLAGTAANEQAAGAAAPKGTFSFCPGRTDAAGDGMTAHLEPRKYVNATVAFKDNAAVRGLTLREAVALAGGLRSDAQQKRAGYSGAWGAAAAGPLSNAFYKALLNNEWTKAKSSAGREEYHTRARLLGGAGGTMTPADVAIKQDPELAAIAKEFAADNGKFLAEYAAAWAKAMNADRFDGPAGNKCAGGSKA